MPDLQPSFKDDLRVPVGFAVLLQSLVALAYIIPIESSPTLSTRENLRLLEPLFFLTPFATLALHQLRPWIGRWFAVIAPALMVLIVHDRLAVPGILTMMVIPVGLAAAMIGLRAATVTAALACAVLIGLPGLTDEAGPEQIVMALAAIATVYVMMAAVLRPIYSVSGWAWEYYQKAIKLVEETRAQRGELEQALKDLEHANRQMALLYEKQTALQRIAEEARQTKSAFVAKVSHEFRTPLNMIIGLAAVMIENTQMYGRSFSPALLEDIRIIQRNCEHLASLVNDVLALSQAQAGQLVLHREPVHLDELILGALDVIQPLVKKKNLALDVVIPPDLPEISCDRTRIRQVILNLLSNAARYTDSGGITVALEEQENHLLVRVTDTGPGISPQDMDKIFEPFNQASEQTWRDKGGSGLGLTISKQFVELHDGKIWLDSQPGQGATFYVSLPKYPPLAPAAAPDRWISQEWAWTEHSHGPAAARLPAIPRAVVYDRTGELHNALASFSHSTEVVELSSLEETVANIRATPAHIALLGAHHAQDLNSLMLHTRRCLPDTPVIGWLVPERTIPALNAGADQYLVKPVQQAVLFEAVRSLERAPRRVLIADDDPDARLLLSRMVALYDPTIEIETAACGREALDMLSAAPADLLLLDLVMPDSDGNAVLTALSQDPAYSDLMIIVVSAQDPMDNPPVCQEMVLTLGEGISLPKAMESSLALSRVMFRPEPKPYPTSG